MKRGIKYSLGLGMAGLAIVSAPLANLGNEQVSAACALGWENVTNNTSWISACSGKSDNGNFVSKISDDQILTVDLNGYKGEAFSLENAGTGMPIKKIVFNLTGENEITARSGIAFEFGSTPLEFTGEGSLKIKSLIPVMAYGEYVTDDYQVVKVADLLKDYVKYWSNSDNSVVSEVTIKPTTIEVKPDVKPEEPEKVENEKSEDEEKEPNNDASCIEGAIQDDDRWTTEWITIHVAAGIYIVLSLVTFILLGIRKIVRKHEPKATKKIIIEENGKKVGESEVVDEVAKKK